MESIIGRRLTIVGKKEEQDWMSLFFCSVSSTGLVLLFCTYGRRFVVGNF